jgi:hypothetical protein
MRQPISAFALFLALAICDPGVQAQTFQLQGGTSTQIDANGGSIGVTSRRYQGWIGAGEIQGHFRMGAYAQTNLTPNFAVAAGDDAANLTLPTDIFTGGQYILTRGAGALLKLNGGKDSLYVFGGTSSLGYGTGFFRAAEADQAIGLIYVNHEVTKQLRLFSRNAFSGKRTSINGLEWKPFRATSVALAGGLGGGSPYFASSLSQTWSKVDLKAAYSGSGEQFQRLALSAPSVSEVDSANAAVTYHPWTFLGLTAAHNHYVTFDTEQDTSLSATTNQAGAMLTVEKFNLGSSIYQTSFSRHTANAYSFFGSRPVVRWLTTTITGLRSQRWDGGTDTMLVADVQEKLHPRLSLSEFVTRASGSTNVTFGGDFYTNPVQLSVGYQTIYVPFDPNRPFHQALSLNATVKSFGATEFVIGTYADPQGKVQYTFSMNRFLYRGTAPKSVQSTEEWSMGKFVVRGRVLDEQGKPVRGAGVYVGDHAVYSDIEGRFFVRFDKSKAQPVRVAPDEFTAPGFWEVISQPSTVVPTLDGLGNEIEIHVRQLVGMKAMEKLREVQKLTSKTGTPAGGTGG